MTTNETNVVTLLQMQLVTQNQREDSSNLASVEFLSVYSTDIEATCLL
jgi:hypothetical protein